MGRPSEVVEVVFSVNEVMWLWRQAEKEKLTLTGLIRRRSLNVDPDISCRESFNRFCDMKKRSKKSSSAPLFADESKGGKEQCSD